MIMGTPRREVPFVSRLSVRSKLCSRTVGRIVVALGRKASPEGQKPFWISPQPDAARQQRPKQILFLGEKTGDARARGRFQRLVRFGFRYRREISCVGRISVIKFGTFKSFDMRPLLRIAAIGRFVQIAFFAFAMMCNLQNANAGFTFTPGDLYSTYYELGNTHNIIEYTETGTFLASLTVPSLVEGDELHGIVFGSDGFLYAVKIHFPDSGFSILVLDSAGIVHNTYTYSNGYFGNISDGKIALDQQYIFVAGGDELVRFTVGNPTSGVSIYKNNQVFDVKILPNGHLFVAWAYGVDEITNTGVLVRSISLIGADWTDVRGIEYDPAIDKLFATMLGYTNFEFELMRINASTGVLEHSVHFTYGDDLFLTRSNTLLVGSRAQAPGMFDENLSFLGAMGTVERLFVTQCPAAGPTPTPTPTPTPCTGRCSPTPRPRPSPNVRPTWPHAK
jgi:hypothetical protein